MKDNRTDGEIIRDGVKKTSKYIVLVIVCLIVFFGSWYTVPAGERGILLTWGNPSPVAKDSGIHFKIPIAQSVIKMNVQEQKYEADATAASKDLQNVHAKIAVNYHVNPDAVVSLYRDVGINYQDRLIQPAVQEVVKASTALYTAEELITRRPLVKEQIELGLKERFSSNLIKVNQVSITNFDFSESFNAAIEQKVTAEQLKLKAINDLERIKVEAMQASAVAEGEKQAIIKKAEAEAQAVELINRQLTKSPNYIEWIKANRWDGKLPVYTGSFTPFFDVSKLGGQNS